MNLENFLFHLFSGAEYTFTYPFEFCTENELSEMENLFKLTMCARNRKWLRVNVQPKQFATKRENFAKKRVKLYGGEVKFTSHLFSAVS